MIMPGMNATSAGFVERCQEERGKRSVGDDVRAELVLR
jgi:hypothetical protein